MKKILLLSLFAVISSAFVFHNYSENVKAVDEIKEVVSRGYIHGAFNELNPEEMKKTFHEEFAIFSTDGKQLNRFEIDDWVSRTAERKADPNFNAESNVWDAQFAIVDVNGRAASVKLELSRKGDLIYTDYLSLLKFDDGWKIVAKVYHQHNR